MTSLSGNLPSTASADSHAAAPATAAVAHQHDTDHWDRMEAAAAHEAAVGRRRTQIIAGVIGAGALAWLFLTF